MVEAVLLRSFLTFDLNLSGFGRGAEVVRNKGMVLVVKACVTINAHM